MLQDNAVIWKDNTTLIDLSLALSDIEDDPTAFQVTAAQDYLYLGSFFPFNHRFIDVRGANTNTAAISNIELWDGAAWVAAARIIDGTSDGGKTLAKPGIIGFTPDKDEAWEREETSEDVTDLTSLKIYHKYWARLTFSANLSASTYINYVGHKFSDDRHFATDYPDLMQLLSGFKTGKSNWKEQHVRAAEDIIDNLLADDSIRNSGQILDWTIFTNAAVHKAAEIIYRGLGANYEAEHDNARQAFATAMKRKRFSIDYNNNAIAEPREVSFEGARYVRE